MSEVTAHVDENQNNSIIGVQGTLGTADTKGTAPTLPVGVSPEGAMYVYNIGPAGTTTPAGTQDVNVVGGTVVTTMGDLTGGTLDIITDGTIGIKGTVPVSGTVVTSAAPLPGGTLDILTNGSIVVTNGTIASVGTVPGIGVLADGTVAVKAGTIASVGTIPGVGIVGNVNTGSIVVTNGTIAAHAITNVQGGTIGILADGTLSQVGTVPGVGVVGNVNGGSIVVTNGTIASSGTVTGVGVVGNLNGGTLGILTNGTVATNILPLGGVVKTTAVVCGTAATALPASALSSRKSLIGYNIGTIPCYIGDSTVSVTSGIPIGTAQYSPSFDLGTTILYGVASAASGGTLVVLEVS